jgi:hypothetical protein
MKVKLIFLSFIFIANLSISQVSHLGVFFNYGFNLPITNKSAMRLPWNISTGLFYKYIKPHSIIAFLPELYVERTMNKFKIYDKTSLDNELNRLGVNIGSSIQLNNKAFFTVQLSLKYLFLNQMFVNTNNTYYSSLYDFVGLDYNHQSNKIIPGIGLGFGYAISKKMSLLVNIHQSLISTYRGDLIYLYDDLNQKSVDFNLKETKLSLSLTYSLKKDKKYQRKNHSNKR